jgi:transmembrane sensor
MSAAADIEARAAGWLLRQEEPDWTEADQRELDGWLSASAAHQAAFWRLEHGWRRADRLAARGAAQDLPAPRRMPMTRRFAALAASLVAIAGGATFWLTYEPSRETYTTRIGGHEVVPLPDGTRVELNTDTKLRSEITAERRAVWLDKGEAYFDVAHDAAHPFTIYAGKRRVTVLGTRFSVRRAGEQVRVTVVEGKVRLDPLQPARPPVVLTPGQVAIAKETSVLVTPKSVEAAATELSWRQGMLVFDDYTVARAAAEFNRYNRRKIVVTSAQAGAIPIGGTFEVENVDGFVELLEQGYGLKIEKSDAEVKITG